MTLPSDNILPVLERLQAAALSDGRVLRWDFHSDIASWEYVVEIAVPGLDDLAELRLSAYEGPDGAVLVGVRLQVLESALAHRHTWHESSRLVAAAEIITLPDVLARTASHAAKAVERLIAAQGVGAGCWHGRGIAGW